MVVKPNLRPTIAAFFVYGKIYSMGMICMRIAQAGIVLGVLLLASIGVEVADRTGRTDFRQSQDLNSSKITSSPAAKLVNEGKSLVCGDKIYALEFLSCGEEIGRSVENRPLYMFEISSSSLGWGREEKVEKILFIGGLHTGTEKNTYNLASKVLQYFVGKPERVPANIALYIIPKANPDGIAKRSHNNARGVDLNRNWPTENWRSDAHHPSYGYRKGAGGKSPLSEPETNAIYNFIMREQPLITFTWHSQAGTVEDNDIGSADELAAVYAKAAGYTHIAKWPYYETTGTFLAAMRKVGIAAADVELASRSVGFEKNISGVKAVLDYFK